MLLNFVNALALTVMLIVTSLPTSRTNAYSLDTSDDYDEIEASNVLAEDQDDMHEADEEVAVSSEHDYSLEDEDDENYLD